jgi:hypothetical protein
MVHLQVFSVTYNLLYTTTKGMKPILAHGFLKLFFIIFN